MPSSTWASSISIWGTGKALREFLHADDMATVTAIDTAMADADIAVKPGDVIMGVDQRYYRPAEVESLLGDPGKAKADLGWEPQTTLDEMIAEMVACDLLAAKKNRLLLREGYLVSQVRE